MKVSSSNEIFNMNYHNFIATVFPFANHLYDTRTTSVQDNHEGKFSQLIIEYIRYLFLEVSEYFGWVQLLLLLIN